MWGNLCTPPGKEIVSKNQICWQRIKRWNYSKVIFATSLEIWDEHCHDPDLIEVTADTSYLT